MGQTSVPEVYGIPLAEPTAGAPRRSRASTAGSLHSISSSTRAVLYSEVRSGWPLISHRDIIVDARMSVRPDRGHVHLRFEAVEHPQVPEVEGFVRMRAMVGDWALRPLGPGATEVIYEGHGDPGGWLPHWIVNLVARGLPEITLRRLREHAGAPVFAAAEEALRHQFDWSWAER